MAKTSDICLNYIRYRDLPVYQNLKSWTKQSHYEPLLQTFPDDIHKNM